MKDGMNWQACPEFEAVLEDYVSGEVSETEKDSVAEHLQQCAGCSAAVETALHGRAILRLGSEPVEDPGAFFTRRVMTLVAEQEERNSPERGFWKPLEVLAMRFVLASAAAIALLVAYVNISGVPQQQQTVEVRSADQGGIFTDPAPAMMSRDDAFLTITDTRHGN